MIGFLTNRYVLAGAAILVIIGSGVWWMKSHDEAIRATVVAEYQPKIDQLEESVAKAEGNLRFEREQAAKNSRAAQSFATERTVIYRQVEAADQTIQREIATGVLPNPAISPVKVATIDAIEAMERERLSAEDK
ncbi:hypothetical protein ACLBV5_09605 [Brevundimonas sp. M1A4_2e]